MGDFKRLVAWQKAHAFELAIHAAFKGRRLVAAPGFRGQLLRAVGAIPDNLAEGCGKRSRRALAKYAEDAYLSEGNRERFDQGARPRAVAENAMRRSTPPRRRSLPPLLQPLSRSSRATIQRLSFYSSTPGLMSDISCRSTAIE